MSIFLTILFILSLSSLDTSIMIQSPEISLFMLSFMLFFFGSLSVLSLLNISLSHCSALCLFSCLCSLSFFHSLLPCFNPYSLSFVTVLLVTVQIHKLSCLVFILNTVYVFRSNGTTYLDLLSYYFLWGLTIPLNG